jgi:LAGLIDADG endonuclease
MSTEVSKKCNINPWFLTGFSDAEGCFMVSIYKSPKSRVGWRVQPVFQIGLHPKDKELLNIIQTYFDGQGILTRLKDNCLTYRVFSLETLDKIIEHFEKYPLQTQKRGDFELFKSVVMMVKCGKHLNTEGLQEIINYRASLNNGLTPILKEAFPNFILIPRFHKIVNPQVPDPHWLSGFTAGEGCFNINVVKNSSTKTGYLVNLRFQLSQHLRDENLLKSFIDYFGCGRYYTVEGVQSRGDFVVTRLSDILNKIIPFYLNYPIMGIKAKDFQSWYEASELMFKKEHLTLEGLEKILKIKASKNNTPKTRKQ